VVLFGKGAWWLPGWLDKLLPHISIEGETMPASDEVPPGEDVGDTGSGPMEPTAPAPA
jgi:putative drug exporter of the RND superfamily